MFHGSLSTNLAKLKSVDIFLKLIELIHCGVLQLGTSTNLSSYPDTDIVMKRVNKLSLAKIGSEKLSSKI